MIYIISKDDLTIKDTLQSDSDEINLNIDLTGKSIFTVVKLPNAVSGDFIVQKDAEIAFQGIISNVETVKENMIYKINVDEVDNLFDRKIVLTNASLISSAGIEDFIAQTIRDNFTNSADTFLNIPYINISVLTHTKINASVPTEEGIYNFRTYLGNAKEKYGIFIDYEFTETTLNITIFKKGLATLQVDATTSDVITYDETYKIDAIAKVTVLAKETGTSYNFFLLTNRTITTDSTNTNRAKGGIEAVACETDVEAYQKAVDTFKGNSYQHNISLTVTKASKIYNQDDFIVGRSLRIKTEDNGIYDTFISAINKKSNSNIYTVTCGNMKVTLLEKLKGVV